MPDIKPEDLVAELQLIHVQAHIREAAVKDGRLVYDYADQSDIDWDSQTGDCGPDGQRLFLSAGGAVVAESQVAGVIDATVPADDQRVTVVPTLELKNKSKPENDFDAFQRACDRLLANYHLGFTIVDGSTPWHTYHNGIKQSLVVTTSVLGWMTPIHFQDVTGMELEEVLKIPDYAGWFSNVSHDLLFELDELEAESLTDPVTVVEFKLRRIADARGWQIPKYEQDP